MVALLAAAALAVQIDTSADATLPCPAHAALLEELQRRSAASGPAEAAFEHQAGSWRLTLRRGKTVLLRREWPLPALDCALLADTAALVIDRYFSRLRSPPWPARPRRIAALGPVAEAPRPPAPETQAELSLAADAAADRAVLIPSMPAALAGAEIPRSNSGMVISAGLAALDDLRPGLWLQAERRWASGSASFLIVAGSADRDMGPARETELRSALMAVSLGPCFDLLLRACFAPFAGARGRISPGRRTLQAESELKLVPELGAVASLDRALPYRLHAGLSVLVGKTLGQSDFDPDAPPQEIDLAVALRVGYQF
jgi:hypothetical protein